MQIFSKKIENHQIPLLSTFVNSVLSFMQRLVNKLHLTPKRMLLKECYYNSFVRRGWGRQKCYFYPQDGLLKLIVCTSFLEDFFFFFFTNVDPIQVPRNTQKGYCVELY